MVDGSGGNYYRGRRGTSCTFTRDGRRLAQAPDRALRVRRGSAAVGDGETPHPGSGRDQVGDRGGGLGTRRGTGHGSRPRPGAGGPTWPGPAGMRALRSRARDGHATGGDRRGARAARRGGRGETAALAREAAGPAVLLRFTVLSELAGH